MSKPLTPTKINKKKFARITRRCPFCYAPKEELRVVSRRAGRFSWLYVECTSCQARGPSMTKQRSSKAEVIWLWNHVATISSWTKTAYQKELKKYLETHE